MQQTPESGPSPSLSDISDAILPGTAAAVCSAGMHCDLLLIRHGQTDCNADGSHQIYETPLSALGREQARRLAERLRRDRCDALYSSDLARALETAEAISEATGLTIRPDPRLREHDLGIFKGLTREAARAKDPAAYQTQLDCDCDFQCPGGESIRMVQRRMDQALREIAQTHLGQRVIVVTHGRALQTALMTALEFPDHAFRRISMPNAGVNHFRFADGTFHLHTWGDTRHLSD